MSKYNNDEWFLHVFRDKYEIADIVQSASVFLYFQAIIISTFHLSLIVRTILLLNTDLVITGRLAISLRDTLNNFNFYLYSYIRS